MAAACVHHRQGHNSKYSWHPWQIDVPVMSAAATHLGVFLCDTPTLLSFSITLIHNLQQYYQHDGGPRKILYLVGKKYWLCNNALHASPWLQIYVMYPDQYPYRCCCHDCYNNAHTMTTTTAILMPLLPLLHLSTHTFAMPRSGRQNTIPTHYRVSQVSSMAEQMSVGRDLSLQCLHTNNFKSETHLQKPNWRLMN